MMTSAPSYSATATALSSSGGGADQPDQVSDLVRLVKRPLVAGSGSGTTTNPLQEACKKRRKQSTPIRISTTESSGGEPAGEGQAAEVTPPTALTPTTELREPTTTPSTTLATPFLPASPVPLNRSPVHSDQDGPLTAPGALLPTWMSEHVQALAKPGEQQDWLPLQGMAMAAGTTPLYFSQLAQAELPRTGQATQPPSIRIFNPEAYCELCNKEFCNKYFLKTHKANKHRIYSDPPVSEMLMNIPNFSAPAPIPPHIKKNAVALSVDVTKNNDLKATGNYGCDVCAKVFSYKILLKNHKKNVHGIVSEPETGAEFEAEQIERKVLKLDEPEPGQVEPLPLPLPLPVPLPTEDEKPNASFKNGTPVDISLVKEETYAEQDDPPYGATNSSKMSPASISGQSRENQTEQSSNRLRRIGIMNPEAFCEICCKEYCNKYFLRTHKMKRHGIIIPDDGAKDTLKQESSFLSNWYQIQTSPLNLIMGEQNTNSSGSCGEAKSGPIVDNECDLCGMRFQTAYLAQLHASLNCKGKQSIDIPESGVKTENVTLNNNANADEKNLSVISADAISEDLQKLQSMILQLNNLGDKKVGGPQNLITTCHFCSKEFENKYILQSHLIAEHNIFPEENFEDKRDRDSESNSAEKLCCKICGREGFTSIESFKQHKLECHSSISAESKEDSTDLGSADGKITNSDRKYPAQITVERRSSVSLTPTSSYCEICNKELCNKYFMKTHMQRMHGIEIENGAQIGGVVCNICNKELCSKYFLRVHKHNTHGIVEDGSTSVTGPTKPPGNDMENSVTQNQPTDITDNTLKPDLADLSHRYFSHFSEVCSICSRRFRSTKWLKAHLLGDHGKLGSEKWNELEVQLQQSFGQTNRPLSVSKSGSADRISSPMLKIPNGSNTASGDKDRIQSVQNVLSSLFGTDESNVKQYFCSYCSFSTPVLAFLFVHERSHSRGEGEGEQPASLQCVVCGQMFVQRELLQHHVLSRHSLLQLGGGGGGGGGVGGDDQPDPPPATADQQIEPCTKCKSGKRPGAAAEPEAATPAPFSLHELSKQANLPATYALPQHVATTNYVMQAFLMDEPTAAAGADEFTPTAETPDAAASASPAVQHPPPQQASADQRKFAPSIVFLPVLERVSAPLTVCFTLTPT